ncbi:MAG: FtsH protease activity modulator HflK [Rickettsiaceae bacterium]|nr:MAG: FtsH protease activity modulator HflK [Rickettsiaceae bacterium]
MFNNIFNKSPWDDSEPTKNIFTKARNSQFNFNDFKFDFNSKIVIGALVCLALFWLASGIYEIKEGEESAVLRFGRFVRKGTPGLNYRLPLPFENAIIEKINQSRRIEIGYRSYSGNIRSNNDDSRLNISESTMLTGDENIIELNCDVMWHISDLEKYIFHVVGPEEAVKMAAESAIREIIGKTAISSVLSSQKQEITDKIEELTQKILDQYAAGVIIEKVQLLKAEPPAEVIDAYRDVQTSKADKEREINQAQSYNNDILPKARGEAAKILQEAEGYKQEVLSRANGDSKRFIAIHKQYISNKQLTKDRLYLETMEEVLKDTNKTIVESTNMLPHMAISQKLNSSN